MGQDSFVLVSSYGKLEGVGKNDRSLAMVFGLSKFT